MPSGFANMTGGARYPPRLSREGKLELTKAPRSLDRGCGNSRRFPPGEARADRSRRSVSETRRHPSPAPFPARKHAPRGGERTIECRRRRDMRDGREERDLRDWRETRRGVSLSGLSRFVHQTKQTERPNEPDRLYDLSASTSERLSEPRATLCACCGRSLYIRV